MLRKIGKILFALACIGVLGFGTWFCLPRSVQAQIITIFQAVVIDFQGLANSPGNPPAGKGRVYYNSTTGQLTCVTSTGASCGNGASAGGPNNIIASNVQGTGKICLDGTVTNGSPNISSAGQCSWTSADIGKLIWVTNACSVSQCGFTLLATSVTILPSTQLTTARISSITDAQHIVTDCNSPATCSSPNASATNTSHATIIYGVDQSAALNTAGAMYAQSQGCPNMVLPQGVIIVAKQLWASLPGGTSSNSCGPVAAGIDNLISYNGQGGGWLIGQGTGSTVIVFTPDIFANSGSCGAALVNAGGIFTVASNLTFTGAGQSFHLAGLSSTCTPLVSFLGGFVNVILSGEANETAGIVGVNDSVGFMQFVNSQFLSFGGGTSSNPMVVFGGSSNISIGSAFLGGPVSVTGQLFSSSSVFPCGTGISSGVDISGTWISRGDSASSWNQAGALDDVKVENAGLADLDGYIGCNGATSNGFETVAGGTLKIKSVQNGSSANKSLTNAGTFFNLGGNSLHGSLSNTGTSTGVSSESGTVTCSTSTATIAFKNTYLAAPFVVIQDQTTAGVVTQTSVSASQKVVGCPGASDVLLYTVTPNPI